MGAGFQQVRRDQGDRIDRAGNLAGAAAIALGALSGKAKAEFLRAIADQIEAIGDSLVERATAETGLPEARILGERGRTCGIASSSATKH